MAADVGRPWVLLVLLAALLPGLARAELTQVSASGFTVRHTFQLAAAPDAAWQVLVHPERWWPSGHTWSGDAAHLSLDPEAGGCFCERWSGGSAEHGRIVQARPGQLLRFTGALGPLQEMAVSAVLSVTLTPQGGGTQAVVTYRVSGDASHAFEALAPIVDKVIGQQFGGFAALAGRPAP